METHLQRNDMPTRAQRFDVEVPADIWIPNQDEYITPPAKGNGLPGKFLSSARKGFKFSLKAFVESVVNAMGLGGESTTAGNGLTLVGDEVKLGGTLSEDTSLAGPKNFTIDLGGASNKTLTLTAPNSGGNIAMTTHSDITMTTTNAAGSIDRTSAGSITDIATGTLSLSSGSQASLTGTTAIISTSALSNGKITLSSDIGVVSIVACPIYADNAAALGGGLLADDVYKTATGELRIVV